VVVWVGVGGRARGARAGGEGVWGGKGKLIV